MAKMKNFMKSTSAFATISALLFVAFITIMSNAKVYAIGYNQCIVSIYCDTDYYDWRGGVGSKISETAKSSDGQICIATNFDSYNLSNLSYRWGIQVYMYTRWENVRTSDWYAANGNIDKQCFDRDIYKGFTYRARFWPAWPGGFVHGDGTIYGYKTTQGPLGR